MATDYIHLTIFTLAIFVTIFMGRQLTILELGDDIARGLDKEQKSSE